MGFDAIAAAHHLLAEHTQRAAFANLPPPIAPATLDEAYAVQEALLALLARSFGTPGGAKIAVTTKVMQRLMGIDQPCCGAILSKRILQSPARVVFTDFVSLKLECEVALRLGGNIEMGIEHTRDSVATAVSHVMPAFELVEDRNADYQKVSVPSIVADNCWNAGVVLGPATGISPGQALTELAASLTIDGELSASEVTEDPLSALAWVANLLGGRGRPLRAGQIVMSGSVVATFPAEAGRRYRFSVEGLGATELQVG